MKIKQNKYGVVCVRPSSVATLCLILLHVNGQKSRKLQANNGMAVQNKEKVYVCGRATLFCIVF